MTSCHASRMMALIPMALALLVAAEARAEPRRVLFVFPRNSETSLRTALAVRVRAEIEAMGFEVDAVDSLDEPFDPSVTAPFTVAAARVVDTPSPLRVELWLVAPDGHRFELRSTIRWTSADDLSALTVRVSEQIRAFFQPLREPSALAPPPPERPTSPRRSAASEPFSAIAAPPAVALPQRAAPSPPLPSPRRAPRGALSTAVSATFAAGTTAVGIPIHARWMVTDRLGLAGFVNLPAVGSTVRGTGGSATVKASLVGAEVSLALLRWHSLRVAGNGGVALAWFHAQGSAAAHYKGTSTDGVTAVPFVGAELAPQLSRWVHVRLAGLIGYAPALVNVGFAGQIVATWGRPLGQVSLGAGVDF